MLLIASEARRARSKLPLALFSLKRDYGGERFFSGRPSKSMPFIMTSGNWTVFAAMFLGVACLRAGVAVYQEVPGFRVLKLRLPLAFLMR